MTTNIESFQKKTLRLPPLPLWKWLAAIFLLLSIPFAILFRQATSAFTTTATMARNEIAQEVEKLASRLAFEARKSIQVRELLRDFTQKYNEPLKSAAFFRQLLEDFAFGCHPHLIDGLKISESALVVLQKHYEIRLKKLLPGVKLVKWGLDMRERPDSDQLKPRWVYQKLAESVIRSVNPAGDRRGVAFDYLEHVPMLNRYFTEASGLGNFLKYSGELLECGNPVGNKLMMFWDSEKTFDMDSSRRTAGGFLAVIETELPELFGLQTLIRRKSHEWEGSGLSIGWISETRAWRHHLPYPFPAADEKKWAEHIVSQPDGLYERSGVMFSVKRAGEGLIILTAASTRSLIMQYERKVFFLSLFFLFIAVLPLLIIFSGRRNDGMAFSIRFQIAGLFVFALLLPAVAVFQLGFELLQDRQKSFETDAYKEIDQIRKDLDENMSYAFRQLEKIADAIGADLMSLEFDTKGRFARPDKADEILKRHGDKVSILHTYLFNSYAELVSMFSPHESDTSEGSNLLPLVQSLAKIKLRASGKLQTRGKVLDVSLMDLVVEATGGSNLEEIRAILNARENRAFEMKFSGRSSIFYIGQFVSRNFPGETFSMVMLLRDAHFERMYLRMMIEKICSQPRFKNRIQLYFGENDCGTSHYFYDAPLADPWFNYIADSPDSLKVGRLSETTRLNGTSVKEKITLETGNRKCLFYSFRPISVEQQSVVALFNYAEIEQELRFLWQFILLSLLVSLAVVMVLARIMARSLIEPIVLLRQGVEEVESGNYQTEVFLPGQDEIVELAEAFNKMNQGLDERERMTRYLSRSAVDAVVRGEDRQMGGKKVPATILFSDIRSFTTISESNSAEDVVSLLNEYFAAMNEVVEKFGGDIDKFIGDAIMAQFIPPAGENPADYALNAVKCALEMMDALERFNQQRLSRGLFTIKIGVGINSGDVIAGNIGSPGRMDRTVIGDTVNVASRLEGMSKLGRHTCVIISRSTLDLVRQAIEVEQLSETSVKGKTSAVEMFEVIRLKVYN